MVRQVGQRFGSANFDSADRPSYSRAREMAIWINDAASRPTMRDGSSRLRTHIKITTTKNIARSWPAPKRWLGHGRRNRRDQNVSMPWNGEASLSHHPADFARRKRVENSRVVAPRRILRDCDPLPALGAGFVDQIRGISSQRAGRVPGPWRKALKPRVSGAVHTSVGRFCLTV